jgi:CRISPR-associated protein Csm4
MDVYLYKLKFKGPTHFGETGIDLENVNEWVSSDTIFSAIVNTMSQIYNQNVVSDFINGFKESPPFILSSLFLYSNDNYFLPRPMNDDHISQEIKRKKGKKLKKIQWLTQEGFMKWIGDKNLTEEEIDMMDAEQANYKDAFITEIRPRVSLDRTTQSSNLYHCGYVYFKKDAGLYGLVGFNDLSGVDKFKELLTALGETGLGGEKTYGCGMFEVVQYEKASGTLKQILELKNSKYTLLSLYHPAQNEKDNLGNNLIAYDIVRKKGWITTGRYALPLKRKSVGFIREGSVSKNILKGTLVDVTPDNAPPWILNHRVYRNGYAFTAPLGRI